MTYEKIVDYVQKKFAKVDVSKVEDVAVQIDVTGEGEGAFYVAVKDGKGDVEPYEYYDHDAKVVVDGDDLISLVDGKLDASAAFNEGKIRVEGNVEKVNALKGVLSAKKEAPAKKAAAEKKPAAKKPVAKKAPAAKKPAAEKKEAAPAAKKAEEPAKKEVAKAEPAKTEAKKPAAKKPAAKKK